MNCVYLLIGGSDESRYDDFIEKYLTSQGILVEKGSEYPKNPSKYVIIIPINFPKKLSICQSSRNLVVFHTSDLPRGKGWAPIANIFLENSLEYCLTGFIANDEIDSGEILIKFKFTIRPNDTAPSIRKIDNHLMFIGILLLFRKTLKHELRGIQQSPTSQTFFPRRTKDMNQLLLDQKLSEVVPNLRSAEPEHNCFIETNGVIFELTLKPLQEPNFPLHVLVEDLTSGETHELKGLLLQMGLDLELPTKL